MTTSNNPYTLCGKTILITGASSGIGRAMAIACSAMGAAVIVTGRNLTRLEETVSLFQGGDQTIVTADLTNQDDINKLVNQIPVLDGIIHNAGIGSRVLCKSITEKDLDYVLKPNLMAPILLQAAILAEKKVKNGASIVFTASKAASFPSIGNAIYSASKGAIVSYSKCLSLELAPRQIRVNCICPAMVWTDLIIQGGISKEELEKEQLKYPLKRYGTPEDVANVAVFLLSDVSKWMTGGCIDITGGAKEL